MMEVADWESMWAKAEINVAGVLREERTPRWRQIEQEVRLQFGDFRGLRVVEIGGGFGTNAIQFARRGATATVLDTSPSALAGAGTIAKELGVTLRTINTDLFRPREDLIGAFDVCCSFGLAEHFLDAKRLDVIAAHLTYIQPNGLAIISVPNRWAPTYRAWMGTLKARGHWPLGTEVPFSRSELSSLVEEAGGNVASFGYGSFPSSVIKFLLNPGLNKLGRRGLLTPEVRTPFDRLAYELTVFAQRTRIAGPTNRPRD